MRICKLNNEELRAAVEIKGKCYKEDFKHIIPEDNFNAENEYEFICEWLNDKDIDDIRRVYGAFEEEKLIGFVGASLAEKEDAEDAVELNYLFVKKEYRGLKLGLKLIQTIVDEFKIYGVNHVIVYNYHECQSNEFYRELGGEVIREENQKFKCKDVQVDVFKWNIDNLINKLDEILDECEYGKGGFYINVELNEGFSMTNESTEEDSAFICGGLIGYNVRETEGMLNKPNINANLYLKKEGETIGAILCYAFSYCLYVDVMWIHETYRGKGLGKQLILQAEKMAKENGCTFSHTCTFSYQSPHFYKACGYEVFGELDDYPDGIVQYFLKKKLI